jgi:Zn-dependent peptidase ImmA (M78 family)/DNA-binding XRE family transcriptional regulator
MNDFCGANLRTARHFHALSLDEIAERVGKTRQYVSRLEVGAARPTDSLAQELADALEVMPEFFFDPAIAQIAEENVHFRRLASTKAGIRQVVIAKGQITRLLVESLERRVNFPQVRFASESTRSAEEIEVAAEKSRRAWGLSIGPIQNLTRVAENAGAVLTTFPGVSREVDALCVPGARPLIITNGETKSVCRVRFDVAHEIAHLVMHEGIKTGDRITESEANRFASALLMPRAAIVKELHITRSGQISWAALPELKLRWKVSKAALVMRAKHLGLIDDSRVRSAFIRLKNLGESVSEAGDSQIAPEPPEVIPAAVELLTHKAGVSFVDLARSIRVTPFLLSRIVPRNTPPIDEPLGGNVIAFPFGGARGQKTMVA